MIVTYEEVNGVRIGVYRDLRGKGPVLVFIHGFPGQISNWKYQLDYFRGKLPVVAYDQRGFGTSDKPERVSFEEYLSDLEALLRKLDLKDEDVILIGHSFGGMVSEWYAGTHTVRGLVLIGSLVEMRPDLMDRIIWNFPSFLWKPLLFSDNFLTRRLYRKLFFSPHTSEDVFEDFMRDNKEYIELLPPHVFRYSKYYINHSAEDVLRSIKCPTLVIVGQDDIVTPPRESERIHELVSSSRLVVLERSGHMVLYERPDEVNQLIEEFVRGL